MKISKILINKGVLTLNCRMCLFLLSSLEYWIIHSFFNVLLELLIFHSCLNCYTTQISSIAAKMITDELKTKKTSLTYNKESFPHGTQNRNWIENNNILINFLLTGKQLRMTLELAKETVYYLYGTDIS